MDQATGILIAEALLKYGPGVARGIAAIFAKETHTVEDWDKIFQLAETPYEAYTAPTPAPQP